MGYFSALLGPGIAIAEMPLTGDPAALLESEALHVANAVPRRRHEFAAGRDCARRAMADLGYGKVALPRGEDRLPVWPQSLVGSITHTDTWAAAAVARRAQGIAAIGIDLEPADPLPSDLWASVCTPQEQAVLPGMTPGLAARLIFCMKEAAFKSQFPLTRTMLEFMDFDIIPDAEAGTFTATYQRDAAPFKRHDRIAGRFAIHPSHIASAVVLSLEDMP